MNCNTLKKVFLSASHTEIRLTLYSRESIMKPDTLQSYGSTIRFLHWTMAACYLFMFATAIAWNIDENLKFLINPHKAVGILLLILSIWRVGRGIRQHKNRPTNTAVTKLGHWAMYALMLAVPAAGIARQIGNGGEIHGTLAFSLLFLSLGHIGMVAYHYIKGESVLPRMLGKS